MAEEKNSVTPKAGFARNPMEGGTPVPPEIGADGAAPSTGCYANVSHILTKQSEPREGLKKEKKPQTRRDFLRSVFRGILLAGFVSLGGVIFSRRKCSPAGGEACKSCPDLSGCRLPYSWLAKPVTGRRTVWQLDPKKCIQCGRCATECVLQLSAVKCVHDFEMCGYCEYCFGFFIPGTKLGENRRNLTSGAENQTCPTGALKRRCVEGLEFEYTIDETLCIGCGRCVKGCGAWGNGSLKLQVRHDRCVNCNECSIARACPANAYSRVPADHPYLFRTANTEGKS
jgi:Na+-translocating ferredoxin:NAD+ oxidoreductase subunit B